MILAEKIMQLRKKAGWSQEELAEQLGVTRQSVSKWEGAQSLPDLEKILQMSRLFGVSTDFLLKDELEAESPDPAPDTPALRRVTLAEASAYLALRREAAPKMALGTLLCVWSPVTLIGLSFVSEAGRFPMTQNAAAGLGLCVLLILVAIGVALFLSCGRGTRDFAFLETEPFETEYGVSGMVKERRRAGEDRFHRLNTVAAMLCVLAVLPLFAAVFWGVDAAYILGVCLTIVLAGIGAALFVYTGTQTASAKGMNGDVTVTITFENGVATACDVDASTETESLGQAAAPTVADAIVAGNTPNVDAVSGSTVTSNAIMEAAKACYDAAGIAY